MGTFDNLNQDNLAAMADSLDTSAELKKQAALDQLHVAKDMHSFAAIAKEIHAALVENTDTMRDMSEAVVRAAERAEDAAGSVYQAVDERTVETLKDVDAAARLAVENSQANARQAVEELEAARKAMLAATVTVCVASCAACLVVLLVAIGAMWLQFQAGAAWLSSWGWLALPLSMLACGGVGFFVATSRG